MGGSPKSRREFINISTVGVGAALAGAGTVLAGLSTVSCAGPVQIPQGSKPVGFAFAGVGSLTTGQILPALASTQYARPAGLITSSPDRVRPVADQYGISPDAIYTYDGMARMADNPDIDAVYVVTPNSLHREHAIAAAAAGKHVLCEKPMATSVSEGEEMLAACEAAGVKLAVAYRLQFEPHHLECVRLAREKVFGDLKMLEASFGFWLGNPDQWRLKADLAGGGSLVDVGVYAIQVCRYVSGEEPVEVMAFETKTDPARFSEVDESMAWQMRFPSGCLASCASSYNVGGMNRFKAVAENGWFGLEPAFNYSGMVGSRRDGEPLRFDHVNHFGAEMDDFAQCILEDRRSKVDGVEGLRDVRIIQALYESARTGRAVELS